MSLGEFLLPVLIVYFLTFIYWRTLWQGVAIIILLVLPIFTYLTIKDINIFSREKVKDKEYPCCVLSVGEVPKESPTNIFIDNPDIDKDPNGDLS